MSLPDVRPTPADFVGYRDASTPVKIQWEPPCVSLPNERPTVLAVPGWDTGGTARASRFQQA